MTEQLHALLDSFRKSINNDRFDYSYERNYNDVIDDIQRRLAKMLPVAALAVGNAGEVAERLYQHIAHGDDDHRAWLRRELISFFATLPALPQQRVALETVELARRTYRSDEMSAGIMRDASRTGGWEGSERVARQFDHLAANARQVHASLTPSLQQWQPIEHAPRDGTAVLLGLDSDKVGDNMAVAEWDGKGWVYCDDAGALGYFAHPTHWMPLPTAPKQEG